MRDYLELGCVPSCEDCEQVGFDSYDPKRARLECRTLIRQLVRMFGEGPDGTYLAIKSNPHDFGTYLDVVCYYEDEEGEDYAFKLENGFPEHWDEEAKKEIDNENDDAN